MLVSTNVSEHNDLSRNECHKVNSKWKRGSGRRKEAEKGLKLRTETTND